jgi:hypothetical protein
MRAKVCCFAKILSWVGFRPAGCQSATQQTNSLRYDGAAAPRGKKARRRHHGVTSFFEMP